MLRPVAAEPDQTRVSTSAWRIYVPPVSIDERIHKTENGLLWQARGSASFHVSGKVLDLTVGHALWVPAGVQHSFTVNANSVLLPMFFNAARTATTLRAPTIVTVDHELRTLFLARIQTDYSIIKSSANIAHQILALIEATPVRSYSMPLPATDSALAIAGTLQFNAGDDRTLAELAASVHASARTIERAFLSETGLTFREWRTRNRMESAALLLRSATNLGAVANRVGYLSASSFGRAFKRHFGVTPSEFSARYRVAH